MGWHCPPLHCPARPLAVHATLFALFEHWPTSVLQTWHWVSQIELQLKTASRLGVGGKRLLSRHFGNVVCKAAAAVATRYFMVVPTLPQCNLLMASHCPKLQRPCLPVEAAVHDVPAALFVQLPVFVLHV